MAIATASSLVSVASVAVSTDRIAHLDVLNVTVSAATSGDWLGIYCLENDDDDVAVGDFLDRRDLQITTDGHATVAIGPLVNMRCALQLKLVASDSHTVRAVAPTLVRFRKGDREPTQRRLAVTTEPTEMRIAWTSGNVTDFAPRVRFGKAANALDNEARANAATSYDASDMCRAPATTRGPRAFRDPGVIYDATMRGLVPGETYYYQVGSDSNKSDKSENENDNWSDVVAFRVPPAKARHLLPPTTQARR